MSNQKKEALNNALYLLLPIAATPVFLDYFLYNGLYFPEEGTNANQILIGVLKVLYSSGFWKTRMLFVVSVAGIAWLSPLLKKQEGGEKQKKIYAGLFVLTSIGTIAGYFDFVFYDLYVYPAVLIAFLYSTNKFFSLLKKGIKEEDAPVGVSDKESGFMFEFPAGKQTLKVSVPQMNFWIDAAPGGGKSESIIGRVIQQAAHKGYPMLVYDFEGDPTEEGAPLLNKIAYTAVMEGKETAEKRGEEWLLDYAFINFTDLTRTVRVNPLAPRYMGNRLFVQDLVENLMKNLSAADAKEDFWAKYGTAYIFGIAWMLVKKHPEHASIPHLVSIALNDIDSVLRWASSDDETQMIMRPLISAWNKKADGQLAGAETSAQLPVSVLFDPNVFWVLSEDTFSLDVTNRKKPYVLGVGNSKKLQQALAPAISTIISVVMKEMNSPGKLQSVLVLDEFPTIRIKGIRDFTSTARKHFASTLLGLQNYEQAKINYGREDADVLRGNCSNQFFGLTGNVETAKYVSELFGKVKRENISVNTSTDSQSINESLQREEYIQPRDVMIQNPGHMMGKIAFGNPPLFDLQFDRFQPELKELPIISDDFRSVMEREDYSEEQKQQIIKESVDFNFYIIIEEAKNILAPYTKEAVEVAEMEEANE